MQRRVAGTVIIDGTDDEIWPESDEATHQVRAIEMVLSSDQPAVAMDIEDVRWGGECRVEIRVTARVLDDNQVQVAGDAKLFEGTSEDTPDMEDRQVVEFIVPKGGRPAHHFVQLRSTGVGGGDHAEITFSLTNSVVED